MAGVDNPAVNSIIMSQALSRQMTTTTTMMMMMIITATTAKTENNNTKQTNKQNKTRHKHANEQPAPISLALPRSIK